MPINLDDLTASPFQTKVVEYLHYREFTKKDIQKPYLRRLLINKIMDRILDILGDNEEWVEKHIDDVLDDLVTIENKFYEWDIPVREELHDIIIQMRELKMTLSDLEEMSNNRNINTGSNADADAVPTPAESSCWSWPVLRWF